MVNDSNCVTSFGKTHVQITNSLVSWHIVLDFLLDGCMYVVKNVRMFRCTMGSIGHQPREVITWSK